MKPITLEVDKKGKEIKVDCSCGNVFFVTGDLPTQTLCDFCERAINLKKGLELLNE